MFQTEIRVKCYNDNLFGIYPTKWRSRWGPVQLECLAIQSSGSYKNGGPSGRPVYTAEGETRLTTHSVRARPVQQDNLPCSFESFMVSTFMERLMWWYCSERQFVLGVSWANSAYLAYTGPWVQAVASHKPAYTCDLSAQRVEAGEFC